MVERSTQSTTSAGRTASTPLLRGVKFFGALLLLLAQTAFADGVKLGLKISVDGEGLFFNPIVTKINVKGIEPESLAAKAGIVPGDEITSIEGKSVKGRRASELKEYIIFGAGESRTFIVRRADGVSFEVKLTKPKE